MRRMTAAFTAPLIFVAAVLFVLSFVVPRDLAPVFWITGLILIAMATALLWIGVVKRIRARPRRK